MYTKFDFPEIFRKKLYDKAEILVKSETTKLEKELLEQHSLLTELTDLNWHPPTYKELPYTLGFFIGAAEGLDNVHEAYFLSRDIKNKFPDIKIRFITSGAIGITKGKYEEIKVPGTNAKVMARLLYEYGVSESEVITESVSLHTGMQATEIGKILRNEKIREVITISDYWHGARLVMTMIGINPDIRWFNHTVKNDKDNINNALFDWGQEIFQTPLLIAEVARIHKYVDENIGPCTLDGLCGYLFRFHPGKLTKFVKNKKLSRLKFLWDYSHTEVLSKFDKFKNYR